MAIIDFIPKEGERRAIVGQTGSGKTNFALWILEKIDTAPFVIYDTKVEPKFNSLARSTVVDTIEGVEDALEDVELDYVIFRPPPQLSADIDALDDVLMYHLENWHGVGAYVDEMYHFHRHGNAGPGLNGIFTRGRSRGITFIGGSQRPSWVSKFFFSEAQGGYIFHLGLEDDRKAIGKAFAGMLGLPPAPKHHFYYVHREGSLSGARPVLMKPIALVDPTNSGYIDSVEPPAEVQASAELGHAWIGPRSFWSLDWGSER